VDGLCRDVKAQVGDHVRQGQLLVALDARDLDAAASRAEAAREEARGAIPEADSAVASAQADLELVQVTFKRMKELHEKQSISDQEFDQASTKLRAAEAALAMKKARRTQLDSKVAQAEQELRAAQVARSYAQVEAPFAGVVTVKSVEPGNLAVPGMPLLTIEHDGYRLEASVEESKLSAIHVGQPVAITLDGINQSINASVSDIVPAVDPSSRVYTVKIDLPSMPALRSGIFCRASFQSGGRSVLTIPAAAVTERGQLQSVFVVDGGKARTRLVTVGDKLKDQVDVLSGLSAGDKVIFPVPDRLADGDKVEVRP
jgi:RND family efflux transporter MFP subunit